MHIKKEWLTSHKKVVIVTTICAILLTGMGITVYAYTQRVDFQFTNEDKIVIEFGSEHDKNCSTYLKDGLQLEGCVVEVDGKKVKEKDYFQVGEYALTLKWNDKEISKLLEVKDTTPPTFEDFKEKIEIEQGSEDIDLTNYFKAKDLSNVKIEVTGDVDFNSAGTYEIKVIAIDEYKNTVEKVSSVIVTAVEEKEEASVPITTTNTQENASQNNASTNNNGGYSTSTEAPQPTPEPTSQPTPAPVPEPAPAPQPPVNVCPVPDDSHVWSNNSGMVFGSDAEASAWARQQIRYGSGSQWENCSYTVFAMGCNGSTPQYGVFFRVLIDK